MWFNSKYYHLLYQHRDEAEAQAFLQAVLSHLNQAKGSRFVDLACGKGRHSHYLAQQGYEVLGLDLAADSIAQAQAQGSSHAQFAVHDLQEALPNAWGQFDVLCNLFTSFGYFDSDETHRQTLAHWRAAAKPDAKLILDFMNVPKVIKHLQLAEVKTLHGIEFHLHRLVRNGYICKHIQFWDEGQFYEYEERVRAFTLADFERLLEQSGWILEDCFGNYALAPYEAEQADRCIVLAKAKP
jgi:SAM-dependent methyltransferase